MAKIACNLVVAKLAGKDLELAVGHFLKGITYDSSSRIWHLVIKCQIECMENEVALTYAY